MARLGVANIRREYPNAPGHLLRAADDLRPTRELHPAFFGSYDWHSAVHQHWLLVRLLRLGVAGPVGDDARRALSASLTPHNLQAEADYLRERPGFERTYGWAWTLKLADEVAGWTDAEAGAWGRALAPLVAVIRANWLGHLGRAGYPIRAGTHANSAFALILALDHARAGRDDEFADALLARAHAWFGRDAGYPAHLEPGGEDFLSNALVEALLMTRLLDGDAFGRWLGDFLPSLAEAQPPTIFIPATVADRGDPKTVHLDGLNLSRAWCWRGIAAALDDERGPVCRMAAERHLQASVPHLFSGNYAGEHWLTSFALLALTE